ncbi:hypothetical protein GPECTOR_31g303 [Gonium pectorale]|uniref:Uncharacterized protein n=1 Tax=Gonium pectorale TaxID=33097 RepID=A0A150GDL1_GONPE|nr:hypothetical protein GPECTOR_31g303 [Gonium pectorale]|eukprot:KXZ47941.1 hypothetical protein GPECTOR_31g303 [Gonium pectorale]
MEPSGKEIREGWDPMDMSYMQLLDAAGPAEEAPGAEGNLDILVDVVSNLERGFVEAKPFSAGSFELGSGSLLVPLMKDESGALRVQLELPEERPDVMDASRVGATRLNAKGAKTQLVVGSRRVHALLLQLQRRQLWRRVAAGLERDAAGLGLGAGGAGGGGGGAAGASATAAGAGGSAAGGGGGGGGGGGSSSGGGGHPVHVSLARLAHALPFVTLRWRPCGSSILTSAMEVHVGPAHRVLLLIRDGLTDMEGVVQATGTAASGGAGGSRWVRDTHMGFSRHDVPAVLRSLLQTLGMPLERLLGVAQHTPPQHAPHAPQAAVQHLMLANHGSQHGSHSSLGSLGGSLGPVSSGLLHAYASQPQLTQQGQLPRSATHGSVGTLAQQAQHAQHGAASPGLGHLAAAESPPLPPAWQPGAAMAQAAAQAAVAPGAWGQPPPPPQQQQGMPAGGAAGQAGGLSG